MARRDAEVDALADWIEKLSPAGEPYAISGDMNLDDDAPQLVPFVKRLGVENVLLVKERVGSTWDPQRNPNIAPSASLTHPDGTSKDLSGIVGAYHDQLQQRPDHIYLGGSARGKLKDASIVLDAPIGGIFPSDHFGVLATLEV
jgi:hypothetical protein